LLDGVCLRVADIDIFSGQPVHFQGFLGAGLTAYSHPAELLIGDLQLRMDVAFSAQPLSRQILGRDALYYLTLGLRERALELYVEPEFPDA